MRMDVRRQAGGERLRLQARAHLARRQPGAAAADEERRLAGAFGLLVLASPDPTRYTADMGTDFLARIGEVASAALTRLLPTT